MWETLAVAEARTGRLLAAQGVEPTSRAQRRAALVAIVLAAVLAVLAVRNVLFHDYALDRKAFLEKVQVNTGQPASSSEQLRGANAEDNSIDRVIPETSASTQGRDQLTLEQVVLLLQQHENRIEELERTITAQANEQ